MSIYHLSGGYTQLQDLSDVQDDIELDVFRTTIIKIKGDVIFSWYILIKSKIPILRHDMPVLCQKYRVQDQVNHKVLPQSVQCRHLKCVTESPVLSLSLVKDNPHSRL